MITLSTHFAYPSTLIFKSQLRLAHCGKSNHCYALPSMLYLSLKHGLAQSCMMASFVLSQETLVISTPNS